MNETDDTLHTKFERKFITHTRDFLRKQGGTGMARKQKVGWALTVAGSEGGDREGFVSQVRVFKLRTDAKNSGSACVFSV